MNKLVLFLVFLSLLIFSPSTIFAQQGCCSWHNGISHCDSSSGRYVCNDGSYSPTCKCTDTNTTPSKVIPPLIPPEINNTIWCGVSNWHKTKTEADNQVKEEQNKMYQLGKDSVSCNPRAVGSSNNDIAWFFFGSVIGNTVMGYKLLKKGK